MGRTTALTELVGLRHPLVQAGMAGGPTTPELVGAVSEAGALGTIGAAMLSPDALCEAIRRVRELTARPFAVNLFAGVDRPLPATDTVAAVDAALAPRRRELGLEAPERGSGIALPPDPLEAHLEIVVAERVPVVSFTFGTIPIEALRAAGAITMATATTVAEAQTLADLGVDAIVAQGAEAGGHRGTFAGPFEEGMVGTVSLVPRIVDAVDVPVVASGGIADGRGVAAALALGAAGAQLGTAFLVCPESGAPQAWKDAVLEATDTATTVTRVYTGRPARTIRTPLIEDLERSGVEVAGFPAQAALLADLRDAGTRAGRRELMLLLAGQGAGAAPALPAAELVEAIAAQTDAAITRIAGAGG